MRTKYRGYIIFLSIAYLCIILGSLFLSDRKEATGKELVIAEIRCGNYLGSGILYDIKDGQLIFAAPKHLLLNDISVELNLLVKAQENSNMTEIISVTGMVGPISMYEDLGFVLVDSEELTTRQRNDLRYPTPVYGLTEGDLVFGKVSNREKGIEILQGHVINSLQFIPDVNTEVVVIDFPIHEGMSGGALFNSSGFLAGMLIAGNTDTALALPVSTIQSTYLELFGTQEW